MRAEGLRPRTLTLKVKLKTFDVITRAVSIGGCGGGGGNSTSSHSDPAVSSLCAGISSFCDAGRIAAVAAALFRAECLNSSSSSSVAAASAAPSPPVRLLGIRLSNWENAVVPVERGQKTLDDVLAAALRKEAMGGGGAEAEAEADDAEGAAAPPLALAPDTAAEKTNPSSFSSRPSPSTWTCSLCTFAETRNFSLRCDVCGTPRGATGCGSLLAEGAVAEERAVAGRGRASSSRDHSKAKKRPLASSAALDAFFVRKK